MSVEVRNLSFSYGDHCVLRDVSFRAGEGELLAVLGPNGVGKSTLFRCILGLIKASRGEVLLDGRPLAGMSRRDVARHVAYIPQSAAPAFDYTVLDLVLMGVTNEIGTFETPGATHTANALAVLEELGIAHLRDHVCNKLSGGERQLALLGRCLAQNARVLVMDEPTASLDYGNQHRVMRHISDLVGKGYTVVFSTHDPNLALRHAARVLALKDGRMLLDGEPEVVLTETAMAALYGIDVSLCTVEAAGRDVTVAIPRTDDPCVARLGPPSLG